MALVETSLVEGVMTVTLADVDNRNTLSAGLTVELVEVLDAADADPDVRVVVLTNRGRVFCAGADLTEFGTAPSLAIARQVRWERDVWGQLLHLPIPVVVAPHGYCIGSGVEIVLLGDIRVGAAGTVFAMPEVHLGMIPAAGGTQTLPRSLGRSGALYLLLQLLEPLRVGGFALVALDIVLLVERVDPVH